MTVRQPGQGWRGQHWQTIVILLGTLAFIGAAGAAGVFLLMHGLHR